MSPQGQIVTVAVDAMGGDHAPQAVLDGVAMAVAADTNLRVLLVGPEDVVQPFAAQVGAAVEAVVASEVIGFDEHPAQAVRAKRDSSIVVGAKLVKEGRADAFFSAGSTGAAMAASLLTIGRVKGVTRPAIATTLPGVGKNTIFLDVGANADCTAEHLVQFALMGAAYSRATLGVQSPTVALLNIGEEPGKGSALAQEAYGLMSVQVPGFIGNAEGRDLTAGFADVIVTDGFTGNVALKVLEGTSKQLVNRFKGALKSSLLTKLAALTLIGPMKHLKNEMDPDVHGGAPLLGINGVSIIGHGSSSPFAVSQAIRVAALSVRNSLTEAIAAAVAPSVVPDAGAEATPGEA